MAKNCSKKKKGRKKKNNYFTKETENAIIEFQLETDPEIQKKIFVERIRPIFLKLVENIIFVYKFHTLGEVSTLKDDCISFLFESLNKFDRSRGTMAFSYFNVIAKHWFIQRVKMRKRKMKHNVCFDQTLIGELEKDNHQSVVACFEDDVLKKEFSEVLKEEMRSWRQKFDKPQEKAVLEAIILLFDQPDLVTLYNKKSIYMYMREITGLTTKQVVVHLTKFRKKYNLLAKKYFDGDI